MKVLIVCSSNSGKVAPFIEEQVKSLENKGILFDFFLIKKKGVKGYLNERKSMIKKIVHFQPDLIHAYYGLSGLLANLQRKVPVITTYLGSDINYFNIYFFSRFAMRLSFHNIFVSKKNLNKSRQSTKHSLIPFGVIMNLFTPMEKIDAQKKSGLDITQKRVLFAGSFINPVKNPELAKAAVALIPNVDLIGLGKGYTREQVAILMNAVDVCLMTSFSEGSPQFIKEAMACNCPVVSVDVGDVAEVLGSTEGCYICAYNPEEIAEGIKKAIIFGKRTTGRKRIYELGMNSEVMVEKLLKVYSRLI